MRQINRLIDRVAALDAARLAAVGGATFTGLLLLAGIVAVATGPFANGQLVAGLAAAGLAGIALLYAFRLGTSPASG